MWLTPHMKTLSSGSFARKSLTFWCLTRKCFFLSLLNPLDSGALDILAVLTIDQQIAIHFFAEDFNCCGFTLLRFHCENEDLTHTKVHKLAGKENLKVIHVDIEPFTTPVC